MPHKAARRRNQANREMREEQTKAELYSLGLNAHWNCVLCDVFAVNYRHINTFPDIDLTHMYDRMIRDQEATEIRRAFAHGYCLAETFGKFAEPKTKITRYYREV